MNEEEDSRDQLDADEVYPVQERERACHGPRYFQDSSFDPTGVFMFQPNGSNSVSVFIQDDMTSTTGLGGPWIDEQELIQAAKQELKQRKKSSMSREAKAVLAEKLLSEGDEYVQRVAKVLKSKVGGIPNVEIEYNGVTLETDALVGSSGNPSVLNSLKKALGTLLFRKTLKTQPIRILDDVSGVIKPGRLTLVLGPPGGGKSVFLKLLSGRLRLHKGLRMQGHVHYNGEDINDFVIRRTAALVDQHDRHLPELTALETVKFSYDCQTSGSMLAEILVSAKMKSSKSSKKLNHKDSSSHNEVVERENSTSESLHGNTVSSKDSTARAMEEGGQTSIGKNLNTPHKSNKNTSDSKIKEDISGTGMSDEEFYDLLQQGIKNRLKPYIILRLLGLQDVADTFVGGENLRGLSGGQRKRVTSAEVFAGHHWAMFCDEISTGLDSATTFSVIKSLKGFCHAMDRTVVVSLLQPAPEVVDLFDDIIILADGKLVYHGPVEGAVPFYSSLGFECPPRKDQASFLQEALTPVGQMIYASDALLEANDLDKSLKEPSKLLSDPPRHQIVSLDEFKRAFGDSMPGKAIRHQLDHAPVEPARTNPTALARTRYARKGISLAVVTLKRQIILLKRGRAFYIARAIQSIVMALIISSLFATVNPADGSVLDQGRKALALCVLTIIYLSMSSFPSLTFVFATKDVFFKQRDANMYPPWTYVISLLLAQVPSATVESILFSVVLYFISGLTRTAANFFTFLLVAWSSANSLAGVFRLIAYIAPSMIIANSIGSIALLLMTLTNGFSIVRTSIPPYLIWVYYINPLSWGVRSLAINEMTTARWGVGGPAVLESFGFYTGQAWIWAGVGYLWAFLLIVTFLGVIVLSVAPAPVPVAMVEEKESKIVQERKLKDYLKRSSAAPPNIIQKTLKRASSKISSLKVASLQKLRSTERREVKDDGASSMEKGEVGTKEVSFTPVTMVCRGICYYVNDPSSGMAPGVVKDTKDSEIAGKLQLLKNIDFYSEPGCLTALMGGSGAGKTTLMDVVAGRKTQGIIRGEIIVNGEPKNDLRWARTVGYVEQQDIHSECITVVESLQFSARLRLDEENYNDEEVFKIVKDVLRTVELESLANRLVGQLGGRGLSIEQRKRLSIAIELVANPSVLFMDEPTSGLDAHAASIVMRAVRSVADSQRCCLVTIHQPSMDIFESFDSLVLLQRGGKLTYFGPLGRESCELISYLEAFPGVEPIRPGYNPATWMLEVTGGSMATTFTSADIDFPEEYTRSTLRTKNLSRMDELSIPASNVGSNDGSNQADFKQYATSLSTQSRELVKKYFSYYWHAAEYNFVRIMMTTAIAVLYGLTYLNEAKKIRPGSSGAGIDTIQNVLGFIFSLAIFNGMFNCMTVMPIVTKERLVFYRERAASYYAPRMLSVAQGVAEVPYLAVQSLIMVIVTYWMVGFIVSAWRFFYFLLLFFLTVTMYTFMGQFLVTATPNQMLAQLLAAALNQMFTIFNGFLVTYSQTPKGWKWMNRLSPTTWVLYGLGGSQLADSTVPLIAGNTLVGSSSETATVGASTVGTFTADYFGYDSDFIWWCPLILFAYVLFFRFGSGLALSFVNYQRR